MKKTLVALAALAAFGAQAQSTVTLSGNIDAGYQSIDYKGQKVSGVGHNGMSTSTIQFAGKEDLGAGLSANFKINSDFDLTRNQANGGSTGASAGAATSSTWLNSEKKVGLTSAKLGTVEFGVINNYALTALATGNNFGTAIGGGFRALSMTDSFGGAASAPRFDNTAAYTTPSFSGITGTVRKANKQTKPSNGTFGSNQFTYDSVGVTEYGLAYANGPLNVAFSAQVQDGVDVTGAAANTKGKLNTLGANYTVGKAKLFLMNQTNKYDNNGKNTTFMSAGVDYAMGAVTLKALYGSLKDKLETTTDQKSDILGLGADYALSKRTTAYARYESIKDVSNFVANPATLTGTDTTRTRTAIGVRHTF